MTRLIIPNNKRFVVPAKSRAFVDSSISTRFEIVVDTTKAGSSNDTFVLPLDGTSTYNFDIDWGDGNTETVTTNTDQTHVYAFPGIYTIKIGGTNNTFPAIKFDDTGDTDKLLEIRNWGDIAWGSFRFAFHGCRNMVLTATDIPDISGVASFSRAFENTGIISIDLRGWDFSSATGLSNMLNGCRDLVSINMTGIDLSGILSLNRFANVNENLEEIIGHEDLDLSDVRDFTLAFNGCTKLRNLDVSNWDISAVVDFDRTFRLCASLTLSGIDNWTTTRLKYMSGMFQESPVNPDISDWDISVLTDASDAFDGSNFSQTNYDKLLVSWEAQDTSNVQFNAGDAKYGSGAPATARAALVTRGWTITDGGPA